MQGRTNSKRGLTVLCISEDLPFALKRFCGAENLDKVVTLSAFRSSFGKDYGLEIKTGPLVPESLYEAQVVDRLAR